MEKTVEQLFFEKIDDCMERISADIEPHLKGLTKKQAEIFCLSLLSTFERARMIADIGGPKYGDYVNGNHHLEGTNLGLFIIMQAEKSSDNSETIDLTEAMKKIKSHARIYEVLHRIKEVAQKLSVTITLNDKKEFFIDNSLISGGIERNLLGEIRYRRSKYVEIYRENNKNIDPDFYLSVVGEIRKRVKIDWYNGKMTIKKKLPYLGKMVEKHGVLWKKILEEEILCTPDNCYINDYRFSRDEWIQIITILYMIAKKRQNLLYHSVMKIRDKKFDVACPELYTNFYKLSVIVYEKERLIEYIFAKTNIKNMVIEDVLDSISINMEKNENAKYSQFRNDMKPIVFYNNKYMFGCYLLEAWNPRWTFDELISEGTKTILGGLFVEKVGCELSKFEPAIIYTDVKFKHEGIQGDIDVLMIWEDHLFCFECKAFTGGITVNKIRNRERELMWAAKQAKKGADFIKKFPDYIKDKLKIKKGVITSKQIVSGIIVHNPLMSGWMVDGVPTLDISSILMKKPDSAEKLKLEIFTPSELNGIKIISTPMSVFSIDDYNFRFNSYNVKSTPKNEEFWKTRERSIDIGYI